MRHTLAPILTVLMTLTLAGCLADSDDEGPNQATDTSSDAGDDAPDTDPLLAPIAPDAASLPAADQATEDDAGITLLNKDCLARVGLLGIRASVC